MGDLRRIITRNLVYLTQRTTNLHMLLLHMVQEQIFSQNEFDEIRSCPTPSEKNYRFYQKIIRKDIEIEILLKILNESGNAHIASKLKEESLFNSTLKPEDSDNGKESANHDIGSSCLVPVLKDYHPNQNVFPVFPVFVESMDPIIDKRNALWLKVESLVDDSDPNIHQEFEKVLSTLNKSYSKLSSKEKPKKPEIIIIEGERGVGKSTVVKYFAKETVKKGSGYCFWIDSKQELETMMSLLSYANSNMLDFKAKKIQFESILEAMLLKIGDLHNSTVVVFDSVTSENSVLSTLKQFNYDVNHSILIVLTTRDSSVKITFHDSLNLRMTQLQIEYSIPHMRQKLDLQIREDESTAVAIAAKCKNFIELTKAIDFVETILQNSVQISKGEALKYYQDYNKLKTDRDNADGLPPEQIEKVKLKKIYDEGGDGKVFKKVHSITITVAEKVIDLKSKTPLEKSKAQDEVYLWRKLPKHKNIVRFINDEYQEDIEKIFIRMEWCPFGDLNNWFFKVNTGSTKDNETIKSLFKDVMEGLDFIHRQGLIHRDIKPANILLVNTHDGDLIAKIGDFGIAPKIVNPNLPVTDSKNRGTYLYMSPQQRKSTVYGNATDIWSSGVILMDTFFLKDFLEESDDKVYRRRRELYDHNKIPEDIKCSDKEKTLLIDMTNEDEEKRPSAEKILSKICELWK